MAEYYKNHTTTTGNDMYITDLLIVGKGVLQEDCFGPLLFNMIINALIETIY